MGDVIYQSQDIMTAMPLIVRRPAQDVRAAEWPMFRAATQLEVVDWLIQTVGDLQPFAVVTGVPEVGKSVVAVEAAARLTAYGRLAILTTSPFVGPLELQALLAEGLGLPADRQTAPAAVAAALQARGAADELSKPVVLLIDGAETLSPTVLQYLWLMHRLCAIGRLALQIVFIGRVEFWDLVAVPKLAELHGAIAARSGVMPLSADEALAYLQYRLVRAGAARPPTIPRRLATEILVLGQCIPGHLNVIADAVVAREPKRLRVSRKAISAAVAMLSGDSALGLAPVARRSDAWFALAGGVAAAALLAGWLLLPQPSTRPPDRVASAGPMAPVNPVAPATEPPVHSVPAASAEAAKPKPSQPLASLPAPPPAPRPTPTLPPAPTILPVLQPLRVPTPPHTPTPAPTPLPAPASATPPLPPAAPAVVVNTVTVAPPIMVLPDVAMPRIMLQYSEADAGGDVHARAVVAMLRARGLSVGDPTPVAGPVRSTDVQYYFTEDRAEAEQLGRELNGSVSAGRIDGRNPNFPPPPGTVRVVLSNHSVPTSADAQSPTLQEPP